MTEATHYMTSEKQKDCKSRAWYTLGSQHGRLRQEGCKFKASLGYIVLSQKSERNKTNTIPLHALDSWPVRQRPEPFQDGCES